MGYDYSLGFLQRHAETAKKLIDIAASGEVLVYESETWEPIRQRQQLINGLIANISRNMKDYKDLRGRLRCWTETGSEKFRLYVGTPGHKITGRPPGAPALDWKKRYIDADSVSATGTYVHPDVIENIRSDSYLALAGQLTEALNITVRRAQAKFKGATSDPAVIQYFDDLFNGWHCVAISDDGLVTFERNT